MAFPFPFNAYIVFPCVKGIPYNQSYYSCQQQCVALYNNNPQYINQILNCMIDCLASCGLLKGKDVVNVIYNTNTYVYLTSYSLSYDFVVANTYKVNNIGIYDNVFYKDFSVQYLSKYVYNENSESGQLSDVVSPKVYQYQSFTYNDSLSASDTNSNFVSNLQTSSVSETNTGSDTVNTSTQTYTSPTASDTGSLSDIANANVYQVYYIIVPEVIDPYESSSIMNTDNETGISTYQQGSSTIVYLQETIITKTNSSSSASISENLNLSDNIYIMLTYYITTTSNVNNAFLISIELISQAIKNIATTSNVNNAFLFIISLLTQTTENIATTSSVSKTFLISIELIPQAINNIATTSSVNNAFVI